MGLIRIYELSNYMLISVILVSSSNGSKGKFPLFVASTHNFTDSPFFFPSGFHNHTFIS